VRTKAPVPLLVVPLTLGPGLAAAGFTLGVPAVSIIGLVFSGLAAVLLAIARLGRW
jgi:hypothetical protein